jgi:tetratricopeptide (TPR) repeat protein
MNSVAFSRVILAAIVALTSAAPAVANRESEALRAKASTQIFNLDRDLAVDTFRQAIAADPGDPAAYRGLATALWLSITFRRGNMTVDDFLGKVSKPSTTAPPPPAEVAAAFRDALDRALALSRSRIEQNPKDADAHYQLGAAVGLRASYTATVESSAMGAFRAAREAYDEEEKAMVLDPGRKDAGLIVGTYRYIVATLSLPIRWAAYVVGFGGDKDRGLQMIEEAAAYRGDNEEDARFALILLYNREKRYDDALRELKVLQTRYPRNRLVWLEMGATHIRAGHVAEAVRVLEEGSALFTADTRTRMFGEDSIWALKRGTARAWAGRTADAESDLTRAIALEGRKWVKGRAHLELGRIQLKAGNKAAARPEFQAAIALCEGDNDQVYADEARRLIK